MLYIVIYEYVVVLQHETCSTVIIETLLYTTSTYGRGKDGQGLSAVFSGPGLLTTLRVLVPQMSWLGPEGDSKHFSGAQGSLGMSEQK